MAFRNPVYKQLAITAAINLGGDPKDDLNKAMEWLNVNADETDEAGVVEEVNASREFLEYP
jgi:hypothetical protein